MTEGCAGLRAFVTGGAAGVGRAIVEALTQAGAEVTWCDLAAPDEGRALRLDVTDHDAVMRRLGEAGPFDILVNNAGADQHAFFTDTTPEDWRRLLEVNLQAVFSCTQAVLPAMQAARFGRIVNIGSEAGRQGSKGGAVYSAAKGALVAFGKSIARENARYGITANTVAPGPIRTPMLERAIAGPNGARLLRTMTGATLMGRLGEPREVADAVVFLASRRAGYITGETIGVSGGMGC
ncbi:MAG: 3-oxoacyl-ACP reductase [Caulobacter sp.]|jgi:NAD(P)-dependent dehydrogenase (short-subunit alcohol dehydrogenase family)|nr:3-oxoacyl-ACP reductase [Caulobacter sp.]